MRQYELVLLLYPRSSENDRKKLLEDLERLFADAIKAKDEMGIIDLAFPLKNNKDLLKAYFVSYHLELEPSRVIHLKNEMRYNKGILRYFFYVLHKNSQFITYKQAQKATEETLAKRNDILQKKNDIFSHKTNLLYLHWKAFGLLRTFITRFDEIKPRRFCTHSVTIQKKLRKHIIRARELGLLPYVKK